MSLLWDIVRIGLCALGDNGVTSDYFSCADNSAVAPVAVTCKSTPLALRVTVPIASPYYIAGIQVIGVIQYLCAGSHNYIRIYLIKPMSEAKSSCCVIIARLQRLVSIIRL